MRERDKYNKAGVQWNKWRGFSASWIESKLIKKIINREREEKRNKRLGKLKVNMRMKEKILSQIAQQVI